MCGSTCCFIFFFFNDTATTEIYTLSLHDALPIFGTPRRPRVTPAPRAAYGSSRRTSRAPPPPVGAAPSASCNRWPAAGARSEEHTSELQSRQYLVCRLLLEKKKKKENKST